MQEADRGSGSLSRIDPNATETGRPAAEPFCPATSHRLPHRVIGARQSRPSHRGCGPSLRGSAVHRGPLLPNPDGSDFPWADILDKTSAGSPPHSAHTAPHLRQVPDGTALRAAGTAAPPLTLSLIHISEPTRPY